jgi:MOSC domain-containing protein YiiM
MIEQKSPLGRLLDNVPQTGRLEWIGIRTERKGSVSSVDTVNVSLDKGLEGDHFAGSAGSKRQITLIQYEHLPVIAGCLGFEQVKPEQLRRNLLISGVNLLAFKQKQFCIGNVILEMTGLCHPCSRMEQIFGAGGYNAVRGHGGITARVIKGGDIHVGDLVGLDHSL